MNYLPPERHCNSPVLRAIFSMCQIVFVLENFFFFSFFFLVSHLLIFFLSLCRVIKFHILLGETNITVL